MMKKMMNQVAVFVLTIALVTPVFAQDAPAEVPPPSDNAAVWYLTASTMWHASRFDEETIELARNYREADLDKAGPVIDQLDTVLYYVREGAKREKCSWAVDLSMGPMALLPHLAEMRSLTRILAVSAQVRLARGDTDGAVADWLTIMRMAPHAAADGVLVSYLVQIAMDRIAMSTLADRLDELDRDGLVLLREGLAGMSPRQPVWRAMVSEFAFTEWARNVYRAEGLDGFQEIWAGGLVLEDGQAPPEFKALEDPDRVDDLILGWLDGMDSYYARMIEIAKLPADELKVQGPAFEREVGESTNPLVRTFIPPVNAARRTELRAQSIRSMLDAMIAYRLGGGQAFKQVVDPYDGRPFDFEVTEAGVVLSSRQIHRDDQRVSLTFSAGCAKPLE